MTVSLVKATHEDIDQIHAMQLIAFKPLLEKYQDYDISPGNEPRSRVEERFNHPFTDFYLIKYGADTVGAIRIIHMEDREICRVSPVFILPEFQSRGIAQQVFTLVEQKYPWAKKWNLNTIKEEAGNCHLYEKIGYVWNGKTEIINERMTIIGYEKIMGE